MTATYVALYYPGTIDPAGVALSTDLSAWTLNPVGSETGTLREIGWDGALLAVADQAGTSHGGIWTSPDGITWTHQTTPLDASGGCRSVLWVDDLSLWVASGYAEPTLGHCILTSPDGVTWTSRSSPFDDTTGDAYINQFAWNGSLLVAVGSNVDASRCILTSPDGVTWTQHTSPFDDPGASYSAEGLGVIWAAALSLWVAVGYNPTSTHFVATSPDGATWTSRSTPGDGTYTNTPNDISWDGTTLIAPTASGAIISSTDGTTWAAGITPATEPGHTIIWTGAEWVIGLDSPGGSPPFDNFMTSPDGTTWTVHQLGGTAGGIYDLIMVTFPPASPAAAATYELKVTDPAGTVYATFGTDASSAHLAVLGDYVDELNAIGSFSFTCSMDDTYSARSVLTPFEREIQVVRDGTVVWVGPITQSEVDPAAATVRVSCDSLLGYFGQRTIDRASGRINYLTNPQFESTLTGWTASGVTATADTAQHVLGTHAAKLMQASAGTDTFLYQQVTFGPSTGIGDLMTLVAWFFIDAATWVGAALDNWGLAIKQTGGSRYDFAYSGGEVAWDTPRGTWLRAEVTTWVPPSETVTLEARLYAPGGTIWWDACSLTRMESAGYRQQDQSAIAEQLITFLQDTTFGKDDVAVTTSCPTTGVLRDRAYQYADHINGLTALSEFPTLYNGFDYNIGADRIFRTYYPRRGTDRTGTVTLTGDVNCLFRRHGFDGHQAANSVITLGPGSGPGREEGFYQDTGVFGGRTVQQVVSPAGNPPIDTLTELAHQSEVVLSQPEVLEVTVTDRTVATTVDVGDKVSVSIPAGADTITGHWRITKRAWSPDLDLPTLSLVPA